MISYLLCLFPSVILTEDIYLGIPLGTIDDKQNRVYADVYIADDHTIAFTNFSYKSWDAKPSCKFSLLWKVKSNLGLAVMVGPATEFDLQKQVGPGILLTYSTMNFGWEGSRIYQKRKKRSSGKQTEGIDEWIRKLELKNPKWRIRLDASTTAPENDESYEIVEYVDDEEEIVEENNAPKREVVVYHVLTQDARHNNQTDDEKRATTAKFTTKPFIITTTRPVIIFDKKNSYKEKALLQKVNKRVSMPVIFKTEAPVISTSTTTAITTSARTAEALTTTEFLEPVLENLESSTEEDLIPKDVRHFLTPPIDNGKAVFLLANGAKLTNYKWIGLWNACTKKSAPHIWLDGVDPPREEDIGSLIDPSGYPISEVVRILNCNTLLIPKLFFKPNSNKMNTYFYAGAVNNNVEKKIKIKVIGYDIEEPLEEFSGDDIMLRLPKGIRTFDIDFISIFNDDSNKTLAKTDIPSTLVPPCN